MTTIHIPSLFEIIAGKVNEALQADENFEPSEVMFDYGHYKEITRKLKSKDNSINQKGKKYPLIWLVMDFTERYNTTTEYCELPDVQIIIATTTLKESSTSERMQKNFIPILYPVYNQLLKQIEESGFFSGIDWAIEHEKIDRPYWDGKENQVMTANLFDDFIDAIQIRRMNLIVNQETCDQFRLIG